MLGKNHRIVNGIALFPVISFISRSYGDEVLNLLPDDKIALASLSFACLFTYFYASTLPDIDNKKRMPFKHRTWVHTIWPLLIIGYFTFKYRVSYPYLFFIGMSFNISYFLHLFFDDFSIMGCDMIYPFIGYRVYHGGKVKYRKGFHLELYKTGDESERFFVIITSLLLIILGLIILLSPPLSLIISRLSLTSFGKYSR